MRSPYIVGPVHDAVFFIFTPLLAYLIGGIGLLFGVEDWLARFGLPMEEYGDRLGGVVVSAHLFAVFFRSHGNARIFREFPLRFTLVPALLAVAMLLSEWALVILSVLATWWDVYHSSLQTFGLGRIYDSKRGNPPRAGRSLDIAMAHFIYIGPILAGASFMEHVQEFHQFSRVGSIFFTSIPAYAESNQRYLTWAVLLTGIPYACFYVWSYWRMAREGYAVSIQKALLYAVTAVVSIFAWGFNSFGEAFFIMNFFHAVQYFAIVWFYEKGTIRSLFRTGDSERGTWLALALFLSVIFAYGGLFQYYEVTNDAWYITGIVVALLHFWYDGFIWSVRKKHVS